MRKHVFAVFAVLVLSATTVFGQESENTSSASVSSSTSRSNDVLNSKVEGFRVAVFKPYMKFRLDDTSSNGQKANERMVGVSFGYISIPMADVGWSSNLAYVDWGSESQSGALRLDGNVGTELNSVIHIKAGLNLSTITGSFADRFDRSPAIGFQASVGAQITQEIGVELAWVSMRQVVKGFGQFAGINQAGPELALTGTF